VDELRWLRMNRGDCSLVYRDGDTGCTLQNVSQHSHNGRVRFSDRWLLFTPDLMLLASLRSPRRGDAPPVRGAEEAIAARFLPTEPEPAIASIDYTACYSLW
jgi:hypothetical protein